MTSRVRAYSIQSCLWQQKEGEAVGWSFCPSWRTKSDLIRHTKDELRASGGCDIIASCVKGNILWMVLKRPPKDAFILCVLMKSDNKNGGGWGYKDISECCGPFYYSCPLSYLELAPQPPDETAATWRAKVRQYHRRLRVGERVELLYCKVPYVTIASLKPLLGRGPDQKLYRVPRDCLASPGGDCVTAKES